jgi:hypothetical protein
MDPASHISPVVLFYYLVNAVPLSDDDQAHLERCSQCQDLLEEFRPYAEAAVARAA